MTNPKACVLCLFIWLYGQANAQLVPNLVYPKNGVVLHDTIVQVSWSPVPGNGLYHLQVDNQSDFSSPLIDSNGLLVTDFSFTGLQWNNIYYWRVGIGATWSSGYQFTPFKPTVLSGCQLWLSADSNVIGSGGIVDQWRDLSGQLHHAVQSTASNKPTLVNNEPIINSPTLSFDGANDFLEINDTFQIGSTFILANWNDLSPIFPNYNGLFTEQGFRFFFTASTSSFNFYSSDPSNNYYIDNVFINQVNTIDYSPLKSFKIISGVANSIANINGFLIGNDRYNAGRYWLGLIPEIICYNVNLNASNKILVHNYLMDKYAPPANLGKDIVAPVFCPNGTISPGNQYVSYLWSTGQTDSAISITTLGTYWVRTTDIFNRISYDTIQIFPPLQFNQKLDTTICLGDSFNWATNYPNNGYTFLWNNATTDSFLNISTAGDYHVRITDSLNCNFYSDTITVSTNNFPAASLGPNISLCVGNWLSLDMVAGPGSSFLWSTGGTDSIAQVNITGNYWVSTTNALGCLAEDTVFVTILGNAPDVSFTANQLCHGDTVLFLDASTSSDAIIQWSWDFDDLSPFDTIQNPEHLYTSAGIYNVNLTATTNVGCSDDTSISFTIIARPIASINVIKNCERGDAYYNDNSTSGFGVINQWFWDFGDLSSTSDTSVVEDPNPYYYQNSGTYSVQLMVETINGCRDTVTQDVDILESGTASFTVNKECAFNLITFTNTSTGAFNYKWYFGTVANDSSVSFEPTFTYNTPGNYSVTLFAIATNGCKGTFVDTLNINKYVQAAILFPEDTVCKNLSYTLQDNSLDSNTTINSWTWSINGFNVGNTSSVPINFSTSGNNSINLFINSTDNCIDSVTQNVFVQVPPIASFTAISTFGTIPFPTTFTYTGTGNISSYVWDFDDGTFGSDSIEIHSYLDSNYYNPMIIVTDMAGCFDTASMIVDIRNPNLILNLDINNLQCIKQNGFITIQADVSNFSNFNITSMDMIGWVQQTQPLLENWPGNFYIGGIFNYQSAYQVMVPQDAEICCLRIGSITTPYFDSVVNIVACIPLTSYEFNVFSPFPNPTNGTGQINIIVPVDDIIELSIYDAQGKAVKSSTQYSVIKGVNTIEFDTYELTRGVYTIGIYYRYETRFIKLLKN